MDIIAWDESNYNSKKKSIGTGSLDLKDILRRFYFKHDSN